jgi:hypothetical protein
MARVRALAILMILVWASACAFGVCPVMMISGAAERDNIVLTFRNSGKLLIRQLEFSCAPLQRQPSERTSQCREANALFYPGMQYTVRYPYPDAKRGTVSVAVKSVTTSDGFIWKPSKKQPCRVLRIVPRKNRWIKDGDD